MPGAKAALKITAEAREVAHEIALRGCLWTDGYTDSFADTIDRLRYSETERNRYSGGAKVLRDVCSKSESDPIWNELGIEPSDREGMRYCCEKIIEIMK